MSGNAGHNERVWLAWPALRVGGRAAWRAPTQLSGPDVSQTRPPGGFFRELCAQPTRRVVQRVSGMIGLPVDDLAVHAVQRRADAVFVDLPQRPEHVRITGEAERIR